MAKKVIVQTDPAAEVVELVAQLNQVIADLATLTTKLNADGGVTDTDYAGTSAVGITLTK